MTNYIAKHSTTNIKYKHSAFLMLLLSVSLYLLSLLLPAVQLGNHSFARGIDVLQVGIMGALMLQFGWFANPAYLISIIYFLLKKYNASLVASIIASLISIQSLSLLDGGGSVEYRIGGLGIGYYPWLGSFLTIVASSLYHNKR